MIKFVCVIGVLLASAHAEQLLAMLREAPLALDCGDNPESCSRVAVDFDVLRSANQLDLPNGLSVRRISVVEEENGFISTQFTDKNSDVSGVMVHNKANSVVTGDIVDFSKNKQYQLMPCSEGNDCYVWRVIDRSVFPLMEVGDDEVFENVPINEEMNREYDRLLDMGRADTTTVAEVSVSVYVTPAFMSTKGNDPAKIRAYAETAVAETTMGYNNSNVPIKMKLHCVEKANFDDELYRPKGADGFAQLLGDFRASTGGNYKALRKDADMVVLISTLGAYCGIAYFNVIKSGMTVGVCNQGCAVGYFTFGHETGHMYGLTHNKEISSNPSYPYGYGYLMRPPVNSGFRTNMAYGQSGYGSKLDYFSNPNVTYKGIVTGTLTEYNARVLTETRFAMAAVGAETGQCSSTL